MVYRLQTSPLSPLSSSSSSSFERNQQILERFFESIKSEVHRKNMINYIHAYMKFWNLHEEKEEGHKVVYRYDWLIEGDIQTLQDRITKFIIQKKKEDLSSNGLERVISLSPLE